MTNDELRKMQPLDVFLFWVRERWNILQRRKAGRPKPWSDCPIMQETYFTNVRREDDKVTIWVKENIRERIVDAPAEQIIFSLVAARWFNYIPTLYVLQEANLFSDWCLDDALTILKQMKEEKRQIFTGAFVIGTQSKMPKYEHVCRVYLQTAWGKRQEWKRFLAAHPNCTLNLLFTKLSELPGYGGSGFMNAQCIADLKYTKVLEKASDWWTWCSPGPGSKKGLNIVMGRDKDTPFTRDSFSQGINWLRGVLKKRLPQLPELHAQDVQSCCCEGFKMFHILKGGRPKRHYPGGQ